VPENDVIQEIKSRLNIVDVVGPAVALQRAGRNFKGLCPFHGEKTPSFIVYPESQSYHCFGCGANGDIFGFVMQSGGIEFREALERLARQAGVELRPRDDAEAARDRHRERLHEALAAASLYWHNLLVRGQSAGAKAARAYAARRGLADSTIAAFSLGYAPDSWDATGDYLRERGFSTAELREAGLLVDRDADDPQAGSYDRFRNRLIFPIRDTKGRITGFGARALDDHPPKYLNSPQTPLFDKSATLYGIDAAAQAIRASGTAVIVEGYVDVLIAHQTGHANVVGASGTALTEKQAAVLKKLARRIVLALDADAAGDLAALKGSTVLEQQMGRIAIPVLGRHGLLGIERRLDAEIRIMTLPRGQDPDELLRSDPAAWDRLLAEARPVADHYIAVVTSSLDLRSPRGKRDAVTQLAPLIRAIGDPVERAHYMQKLATLTQSPMIIIEQAVARARNAPTPARPAGPEPPPAITDQAPQSGVPAGLRNPQPTFTAEEHLLCLLVRYPQADLLPDVPAPERWVRSENRLIAETLHAVVVGADGAPPEAVTEAVRARLEPELQAHLDFLLERAEEEPRIYPYKLPTELQRRVRRLEEFNDRLWLQQCEFMLHEAQSNGDLETIQRLLPVLDQKRPQFLTYAPAKSTVFRDSRDPNPV
jgi:DNA primase